MNTARPAISPAALTPPRALTQPSAAARRPRLALAMIIAGLGLIGWMFFLAGSLPGSATAAHWPAAWVGLDGLEALGLLGTGLLLIRRDARHCLTATATATLLLADAWLDVTTATPGAAERVAIGMAIFPELPTSALCAALAVAGLRRLRGGRLR